MAADPRPRKPTAECGVADAVIVCELAQRFAGRASLHQRRVRRQSPQARPIAWSRSTGLSVVVTRARQNRRVDAPRDVFKGAQPSSLNHRAEATTSFDGALCELVASAAPVFAQERPTRIVLIQPGLEGERVLPGRAGGLSVNERASAASALAFRRISRSIRRSAAPRTVAARRSARKARWASRSCLPTSFRAKYRMSVVCATR